MLRFCVRFLPSHGLSQWRIFIQTAFAASERSHAYSTDSMRGFAPSSSCRKSHKIFRIAKSLTAEVVTAFGTFHTVCTGRRCRSQFVLLLF